MNEECDAPDGGPVAGSGSGSHRAVIEVRRLPGWFAAWRRISIRLDGAPVGRIEAGGSLSIPVAPGSHSVDARIDWVATPPLELTLHPGDTVRLELSPRASGPAGLLVGVLALVRPSRVLELRRVSGGAGV